MPRTHGTNVMQLEYDIISILGILSYRNFPVDYDKGDVKLLQCLTRLDDIKENHSPLEPVQLSEEIEEKKRSIGTRA